MKNFSCYKFLIFVKFYYFCRYMKSKLNINDILNKENELLKGFNSRRSDAFGEVYLIFSKHFYIYASLLYKDSTIEAEDVINDIFVKLWQSDTVFLSLENIKTYIYCAIKNSFKNYIIHQEKFERYSDNCLKEDNFEYDTDIIEVELHAKVEYALGLLNDSYAKVLRLFIEGYKLSEIAKILDKPEQIIYNIKSRAIKSLRKRLNANDFHFITFLLNI